MFVAYLCIKFMITIPLLETAISYSQYRQLINKLLAEGKTTGHIQSEEYIGYAKINVQRMNRLDKTLEIGNGLERALAAVRGRYYWVILTEGWCGDAAQNVPLFHLVEKSCANIEVKILLRDDNPALMNQHLTDGSRSIPKLICYDRESLRECFTWGPRPAALQGLVKKWIAEGILKPERGVMIQKWYNEDKTLSLQNEIGELIRHFMVH